MIAGVYKYTENEGIPQIHLLILKKTKKHHSLKQFWGIQKIKVPAPQRPPLLTSERKKNHKENNSTPHPQSLQ